MGLLDDTTHQQYYQGNDYGNYQFTSLDDVITQFQIAYVGEDKIISKVKRADIAFHAQRALQELSFDTFKSTKSYQIDVPASLTMTLPHDYVNYTKLSWTDSAGIKHLLYPTNKTSNPFQIKQDDDGAYSFPEEYELVVNGDFELPTLANLKPAPPWQRNAVPNFLLSGSPNNNAVYSNYANIVADSSLRFSHRTRDTHGQTNWGHAMAVWQEIDVSTLNYLDISGVGTAQDMTNGAGVLRLGISSSPGDSNTNNITSPTYPKSTNALTSSFDLQTDNGISSYLEWTSADGILISKELLQVNVSAYDKVYVLVTSYQDFSGASTVIASTNSIDNLSVTNSYANEYLAAKIGNEANSSTWNNYKSGTPSENQDDYQDDTYWPANGERYGLDPQHAQANGSFYIDQRLGKIHFSSNVSGKTVILDYISDSLGTDGEMQVHKFAEEAMYKWMAHAILATRANTQEYLVARFKKERFAAVRTAKLRLSNIKLEEITQILRGKSKQIKH